MTILTGILSFLGSAVQGFFGYKSKASDNTSKMVETASSAIGSVLQGDAARDAAVAQVISSEANSGYWLAACIRPLILLNLIIIINLYIFGYTPKALLGSSMPPLMAEIFDLLKFGMGGYFGGRTLEKLASSLQLGGVIKTWLTKVVK